MERATRTLSASFLWIAALFIVMNNIVASSPLSEWALPLVLAVIGAVLTFVMAHIQADRDSRFAWETLRNIALLSLWWPLLTLILIVQWIVKR